MFDLFVYTFNCKLPSVIFMSSVECVGTISNMYLSKFIDKYYIQLSNY